MKHYETTAGHVTRGTTFAKINELMIELEELFNVMGHLHNTEGSDKDKLLAQGWLGLGQLMHRARVQVVKLASGRLQ